ncbi:MAG TPA: LUD domain-containing protein, partial [Polyangiaceae bacterium]|nr:LUD domain-containing protein [Polyangiaceae bacterium]
RHRAREARLRALDHHDALLETFMRALKARGIGLSLAKTPTEACEIITDLVNATGKKVIKSKSMTSEEINLNHALEQAGAQVTETDLGELIVQLAEQAPSHVTAPAIHLSTEDIARIFRDKLGMQVPAWIDDPALVDDQTRNRLARDLSLTARKHLRERFLQADVGISGANFLVAETGTVVLLENEGNILLTTALPKRHIVLAGVDKLIETEKDLGVLLRLLPVSATAQRQSCYVSLLADAHPDMHVVLLDHGRSKLMADTQLRDVLTCIRCGACMNVCPVYRNVGGHAYGAAYPGPIGALLMPHLEGMDRFGDLPFASSLCGACTQACPVQIPLHDHLLTMRARIVQKGGPDSLRWPLRLASSAMHKASRMDRGTRLYPLVRKFAALHPTGKAWLESRTLPPPAKESFRRWWQRQHVDRPATDTSESWKKSAMTEKASAPEPVDSPDDLLPLFQQRMLELGPENTSEIQLFDAALVAEEYLRIRMEEHDPHTIAIQGETTEKREYTLGITRAEMLIADTGGVLVDMRDRSQGHPIMLAETHIVVARPSQIVPTVAHALVARSVKRKSGAWGDYQVLVTGPSRTADVEKVLVIPAHGPRKLVVVLCEEPVDLSSLRKPPEANRDAVDR